MASSNVGINEPASPNKLLASQTVTRAATPHHQEEIVIGDGVNDGRVAGVTAALALQVDGSGVTQPVSDAGGSLTVDALNLDIRDLVAATDKVGATIDGGQAADGAAVAGNPVRIAGKDGGGLTQDIATDAAGELQVDVLTLPSVTIATFPDNEPFNVAQVGGGTVETAGTGRAEVLAREPAAEVDLLSADGTARAILYVSVNATADGDNTIIAAVGGQRVYILGYVLTATGVGTFLLQDTNAAPAIHGRIRSGADGGGASYSGGPTAPAFKTAVGEGLEINCPAGVDVLGHITYQQF